MTYRVINLTTGEIAAEKINLHMPPGDSEPGFYLTDVDLRVIVRARKSEKQFGDAER